MNNTTFTLLFFMLSGCAYEDHLRHYNSGGNYVSGPPCLSPDGTRIAFSSPITGNGDIYSYDINKNESHLLFSSPQMDTSPTITSQGDLLYEIKTAGRSAIECRSLSTGETLQISGSNDFDELQGVSPDGKQIIISRSKAAGGLGKMINLIVLSRHQDEYAPLQLGPSSASFSSDGKWILVYRYNKNQHPSIELLDRRGALKHTLGTADFAKFTTTGDLAIVRDNTHPEVEFTDLDGTVQRKMKSFVPIEFSAYLQPHFGVSSVIFIAQVRNHREIWSKRYSDGVEKKLCELPDHVRNWRPSDKMALFVTLSGSDPRVGSLWQIEYATGKPKLLLDLANPKLSTPQ